MKSTRRKKIKGQGFLEFTFAMMVLMIMIYGLIRVFGWTGVDLTEGRLAHERTLTDGGLSSRQQINPEFYVPTPFNAIWTGFSR